MIHVEVTTPDETIYQGVAISLSLPTPQGEITVLEGHIPLVTIVSPGTATLRTNEGETFLAVTRGVVEIDGKSVRMLVQSVDRADGLEEAAIQEAIQRAGELVKTRREDAENFAEATALLERELAKLTVVRRKRSRGGFSPRLDQ